MSPTPTQDIYAETLSVFDSGEEPYEPLTTPEVAAFLDCPRRTTYKRLQKLVDRGELKTKPAGASARVWWRPPSSNRTSGAATDHEDLQRQNDLFEKAQEIANVGGWEYDIRTAKGWWTKKVSQIHGLSPDHRASPEESLSYYHPDDRPIIRDAFERAITDGESYDLELRLVDATDQLRWVRTRGEPQYEDGECVRIQGTLQDITDRKEREHELERVYALLTNIERLGAVGAWEFDIHTEEAYWTDGTRRIHEVDEEFEPTVERGIAFYHPEDRESIRQLIDKCIETGNSDSTRLRLITASGNERWVYAQGEVIETDGERRTVRGYIQDITEQKQREEELERLADEYEAIFENTTDQLALIDVEWSDGEPEFRYLRTNRALLDVNGLEPEMIEGKTPLELANPASGHQFRANYLRCLDAGEPITYEEQHDTTEPVFPEANPTPAMAEAKVTAETKLTPITTDGQITRLVVSIRDITKQKQRERALEQYKILAQTASDVIVTINTESVIHEVNPAVTKVFGYEPAALRGESLTTLMADRVVSAYRTAFQRYLHDGDRQVEWEYVELPGVHADGTEIPLAVSFSEYEYDGQQYFTGIIRDITAREERDQLQRLDRLNTVIRNIGKTVAQADHRDEIEQTVCDTLLEFDYYQVAVIGEFSPSFDRFEPWTWAGDSEGDLHDVLGADARRPIGRELLATAAKTGEVHAYNALSDVPSEFQRDLAAEDGIQSYGAIPLVKGEIVYGVIGLYADQPGSFDEQKRTVLSELGEIVGYALNALERREVLDRAIEIEFRSEQLAQLFPEHTTDDDDVEAYLESTVPLSDGAQLEYWTVSGIRASAYQTAIETQSHVMAVQLLSTVGDTSRFELTVDGGSIASLVDRFDGALKSVVFQDGTAILTSEFPETAETESFIQYFRDSYPDTELTARRRVLTPTYLRQLIEDRLTDRQLTILQMAYFAGYFGQPRFSTGAELAGRVGITKQTFHSHLRKAQEGVVEQLFETAGEHPL